MNKLIALSSLVIIFVALSCNVENDKVEEASRLKYEMENRKLKKIDEVDIMNEAMKKGNEIVKRAGDSLKFHLQTAIAKGGFEEALHYCNLEALPLTNKLSNQYYAQISRLSFKNRNPANYPKTDMEKQLLEAYQYNFENQIESSPNVQILDTSILYAAPIVAGQFCLNCHGAPDENIAKPQLETINKLYPNDKAIGYKEGELRGMWSVYFNKQEFIKNL